jgi:hypothetical protein
VNTIRTDWAKFLLDAIKPITDEFAHTSSCAAGNFRIVEDATGVALNKLRGVLVSAGLAAATSEAGNYHCPLCSELLTPWQRRIRTISTAQGEGSYTSVRYRCTDCKTDYRPIEEANGLAGDQFTTGAKAVIAEAAVDMPFAHVTAALLDSRAIRVSPKEVDRTAREVAGWREAEETAFMDAVIGEEGCEGRREHTGEPAVVPDLYPLDGWGPGTPALISVDGVMVRSPEKGDEGLIWFECRGGIIAPADDNSAARKAYLGGHSTPDEIFDQMLAAWRRGDNANRVCLFIADGAKWIWNRVPRYFPNAIEVLDVYHAAKYVASAAKACWGAESLTAKLWQATARTMLIEEGGPRAVLHTLLKELRTGNPVDPEQARKDFHYLYSHRHRMHYAKLHADGLATASGAMESAVKQACVSRLRRSGMKWTHEGAHALLELRCASLTGTLTNTTDRRNATQLTRLGQYLPSTLRTAA